MTLADIERAVRERRDFSVFERTHLHRATREDDHGIAKGRDRLRDADFAAATEEEAGPVRIVHDLGEMIVFETAQGWQGHRWARTEGRRILAETLVVDGPARAESIGRAAPDDAPCPVHAPLGELRPGRGQLATPAEPIVPPGFPAGALPGARHLHRLWNARALNGAIDPWTGPKHALGQAAWIAHLLAALPDAVLLFERGIVRDGMAAILWRLHGHHLGPGFAAPIRGKRVRAIGSSVLTIAGERVVAEATMLDLGSIVAQLEAPTIDYSA